MEAQNHRLIGEILVDLGYGREGCHAELDSGPRHFCRYVSVVSSVAKRFNVLSQLTFPFLLGYNNFDPSVHHGQQPGFQRPLSFSRNLK